MATGAEAVAKAKTQNGIREVGYSNKVKFNTWFYGRAVSGSAYPWCAAFTSWVYSQIGMKANVDYPHSAGVAVCFNWYRSQGRIISKYNLRPGDQVRYTISHTGIFAYYKNGRAYCWEGNTSAGSSGSQRDGGGVHLRSRALSFIQYGGRPHYSEVADAATPTVPDQPKDEGIFGMSKYKSISPYKAIQKLVKGKWKSIYFKKNANSILTGDGKPWYAELYVTISGLKPGETAQIRFYTVSYKKGTTTKGTGSFPIEEFLGTSGSTFIKTVQIGKTGKGTSGRSNRVRAQIWTNSKTAKITRAQVKYLKG